MSWILDLCSHHPISWHDDDLLSLWWSATRKRVSRASISYCRFEGSRVMTLRNIETSRPTVLMWFVLTISWSQNFRDYFFCPFRALLHTSSRLHSKYCTSKPSQASHHSLPPPSTVQPTITSPSRTTPSQLNRNTVHSTVVWARDSVNIELLPSRGNRDSERQR